MTFRATKQYLFILLASSLFFSCVSNKDEVKPLPPETEIDLTVTNLLGEWQVYFYTKRIVAPENTNLQSSMYRYVDTDGFTITFKNNGKFVEHNVFDGEVMVGDYEITRWKDESIKDDAINFTYKNKKTGKDTTSMAHIPALHSTHFAHIDRYRGKVVQGGIGYEFKLEDIRYYRSVARAPNYMPNDVAFKKNMIDVEELYGTWELIKKERRVNQQWMPMTDEDKAELGTKYTYKMLAGENIYEEVLPNETLINQRGPFKIVDDLVYMKGKEVDKETGELLDVAFLYWLSSPIGELTFISYELQRDADNSFNEEERRETFRRVK